jgi:hypothetical protein
MNEQHCLERLAKNPVGGTVHKLISTWTVPEGDEDLIVLGTFEGRDLYFAPATKEFVARFGDRGEQYSAISAADFVSFGSRLPNNETMTELARRATLAGVWSAS